MIYKQHNSRCLYIWCYIANDSIIGLYRFRTKRPVPDRNSFSHLTVFKWQCQLLTAPFKLLPYQTILKEMNGLSRTEKPLITIPCHPHSLPLSLRPSLWLISFSIPLSICFSWCICPPSTTLSFLSSFLKTDCRFAFHYSPLILAYLTHTDTLSSSAIPAVSSRFCLSVFPRTL